jgi:hypothetical protein
MRAAFRRLLSDQEKSPMLKKIWLLFFSLSVFASQPEPFALITVPKSGSHLLIKSLFYMTGFTPEWHTTPPDAEQLFQHRHFPYTHCALSPSLLNYYAGYPIKQMIGIRDLRDVCVSIVYQIRKGIWPGFMRHPRKRAQFNRLSFDNQLLYVIEQEYADNPTELQPQLRMQKIAEQAVRFMSNPSVLICRYEDLVGPHGGGTEEAQRALLEKIGRHIGLWLPADHIDQIAAQLYGNGSNPFGQGDFVDYQSTFREGKIGSWKGAFKERHKIAFKQKLGPALIALGYEKDDTW